MTEDRHRTGTDPDHYIPLRPAPFRQVARLLWLPPMAMVTTTYRYKRPPKRKKAVLLKVSPIVRAGKQPAALERSIDATESTSAKVRTSAIVTVKGKPGRFDEAEELTSEEHRRRGDAADALFRELVRRATAE